MSSQPQGLGPLTRLFVKSQVLILIFSIQNIRRNVIEKKIRKTVTLDNDMYAGFVEHFLFYQDAICHVSKEL